MSNTYYAFAELRNFIKLYDELIYYGKIAKFLKTMMKLYQHSSAILQF